MSWGHNLWAQNMQVSGLVSDETGEAIPGATVLVKGTTTGMATDLEGRYTITAPGDATLVFSFIGYQTQEVEIGSRSVIDIT